jgi:NhaC family Na+:H+ antiporter
MFKTAAFPFILSVIIYTFISFKVPLSFTGSSMSRDIAGQFVINWIVLVPALIILLLAFFRVNVKLSMLFSIIAASAISIALQGYKLLEILKFMVMGFYIGGDSPLKDIIKGGGLVSMWKAALIVFVSCSLAGILEGTGMLKNVEGILVKIKDRPGAFVRTAAVSLATAAFGCNQAISIVLTDQLMSGPYRKRGIDPYNLALDIENAAVVLAALIPWNIEAFVPTSTLGVGSYGYIPYAFYLYLIPVFNIAYLKYRAARNRES